MKFLAMHITNQKLHFDIFTVGNVQNIFMEHDLIHMIFLHKRKIDNFDSNNVWLNIATNIPVLLMIGFLVKGHNIISVYSFNRDAK